MFEFVFYFNEIVILGVFGKGKLDVFIFEYCFKLMNIEKDDVIMVGDNLNIDILGVLRVGIKIVWINWIDKKNEIDVMFDYIISSFYDLFFILEK